MWDKLKNDEFVKGLLRKIIVAILVIVIALLTFDVLTGSKDGRRQIVDPDGGTEYTETESEMSADREETRLAAMLEDMSKVGSVQVMLTYQDSADAAAEASVFESTAVPENPLNVEGVVVTAEGAGNVVVKNDIVGAVSALYGIPSTRIMVYEKKGEQINEIFNE